MPGKPSPLPPFKVKDCALTAIATGRRAQNLRELRDHLQTVETACIYFHFWGRLLRPQFDNPEYVNDFAEWTIHALGDKPLAERLGVVDPTDFADVEELRRHLIEVIEDRLEEVQYHPWAPPDRSFPFIRGQLVVFDSGRVVERPEDLGEILPQLSLGSIFYHVVDARRRGPRGEDDFRSWLSGDDRYTGLQERLAELDPYFSSLSLLRDHLAAIFRDAFGRTA